MGILVNLFSILGAIIIIGIIILVHELGHYGVGRLCKIKIVEFAVGFGPKIKSWVKNDIKYSIRWIFLGGFTKFYGEDDELDHKDAFNRQPAGRRALTIVAGPVFNILFAFLLAVIILVSFGEYSHTVDVWEGSPAEKAGLQEGDIILSMNGVEVEFYMELSTALRNANDDYTELTVLRDGQEMSFKIPKVYYEKIPEANRGDLTDEQIVVNDYKSGITFGAAVPKSYGFFEAVGKSFKWIFVLFRETLVSIFLWIGSMLGLADPVYREGAGGILEITNMIALALRTSLENVLRLGVAISASLAVFNLLPFPALDGGRLVFIGIEKATGKHVPRNVEGVIHLVGFVLLIGLMGLLLFKDIGRIFGG